MTNEMLCYRCSAKLQLSPLTPLGFRETCQSCGCDAHVCRNCEMFDENAHHECRESSAEWVRDKERANRCEYFTPRSLSPKSASTAAAALSALEDLFKK